MINKEKIRFGILEVCSESEYGSWEFWLIPVQDRTIEDAELIIESIKELVDEKKIYPVEYSSVKDQSYTPVNLDLDRLRKEIIRSMKPENINSENSYWFLATEAGEKEYNKLYLELNEKII